MRASDLVTVRRFAGHAGQHQALDRPIRVAHLTDQHVGRVTPMAIQRAAIGHINTSEPDLVAVTGDFVAHSLDYLDAVEELIGAIHAPVVAVLGNHDHWSGAPDVRAALQRAGALVLDNAWTEMEFGGQRLQVVGVDDSYTGHNDPELATRGIDPSQPTLGLAHVPEDADGLWNRGVELVLAGHTHAGQLTFRNSQRWNIAAMAGHKYVHGLYGDRGGEGALYVSAGIGAAMVGVRIGERARREVAVFELGAEPGSMHEHHDEQAALAGRKPSRAMRKKRREKAAKLAQRRSGQR